MLATGNFRDWHAIFGEVTWISVLKTTMDCHGDAFSGQQIYRTPDVRFPGGGREGETG